MTGFDINEDLKDRCILLGATSCYTEFRPQGDLIYKQPCWFNKITLSSNLHKNLITVLCALVDDYLEELESLGFEDIVTEVQATVFERYIYYWIFCDRKDFLEKDLTGDK